MRAQVSIITPTFNSERFIRETIKSVQRQTVTDWEMLIVDDCSTDNTLSVINEFSASDPRIKVISLSTNSGAAVARNTAISVATGSYIAFLDADDLWLPTKLEKQLCFMTDGIDMSYTAYEIINHNGDPIGKVIDGHGPHMVRYSDMLRKRATVGCSTVMLNRENLSKFRMPLLRTGQDYGLWLQILKDGHNAYRLGDVLTQYRIVPGSISRNKFKKARRQWQIYRSLEECSLLPSCWYFLHYAFRAVFR